EAMPLDHRVVLESRPVAQQPLGCVIQGSGEGNVHVALEAVARDGPGHGGRQESVTGRVRAIVTGRARAIVTGRARATAPIVTATGVATIGALIGAGVGARAARGRADELAEGASPSSIAIEGRAGQAMLKTRLTGPTYRLVWPFRGTPRSRPRSARGRIRTCGLQFRKLLLYPAELRERGANLRPNRPDLQPA